MYQKIIATVSGLAVLAWSFNIALARPNLVPAEVENADGDLVAGVVIPDHAVALAPNIFDLGVAQDIDGRLVQGYAIVHPRQNFHHRDGHNGGPGNGGNNGEGGNSKCYAVLAKGAAWKTTEPYIYNPSNGDGLSDAFVGSTLDASVNEWDDEVAFDIFGAGTSTTAILVADSDAPDGQNELYFGSLANEGAIAVTITWGVFFGPPSQRELVEWDMILDDPDYAWGDATVNAALMDLENIAVHELGHALGLGHPDDGCTEESMYRFADFGETKKRDLNAGDIAGVNDLY